MTDDAQVRKEQVAGLYSRVATTYGRIGPDVFAPFGRWLVACTNLSPGERALDVATGRGAALFAAAEQVGADGFVVGIDLDVSPINERKEKGVLYVFAASICLPLFAPTYSTTLRL